MLWPFMNGFMAPLCWGRETKNPPVVIGGGQWFSIGDAGTLGRGSNANGASLALRSCFTGASLLLRSCKVTGSPTFGGVLEHLAGDQTSTNHGATFAGQCWNTVQHHGGNLRGCWHGWQDQTNQPAPTTGGNVSPPFCNVSPPFFRNPQNAPLPTTGATFAGMLPTFGRSNQRSVLTGAIFGAILAHSPPFLFWLQLRATALPW